jgi:uncharacterized BrkB/YihY/UPF0761 family membrane protein
MSYNKQAEQDRKKGTALLPAAGFILIVALGIVAWFIAPSVQDLLVRRLQVGDAVRAPEFKYVVFGVLFITMVMSVGLIYAIAVPRRRDDVKDGDIAKERKEMTKAIEERKARRRKVKHDMRKG